MSNIVKKIDIIPFINTGTSEAPTWTRIKKSTTFPLTFSPEVKTFDFISSEYPEEELDKMKPALSQEITMFSDEDDYKVIFEHCFELRTGADAHRDVLIAFLQESGTETAPEQRTVYKAWKVDAIIKPNTLDSVAQTISVDLALNSPVIGAVAITGEHPDQVPTFIKGSWAGDQFTAAE